MITRLTTCLCLACVVCTFLNSCVSGATYTLDVGDAFDGLFLGDAWEPQEGPYTQYGAIWQSRCRWARQGASIRIPVFPGVANRLSMRAGVDGGPDQRLRLILNGKTLAEFPVNPDLLYEASIEPALLDGSGWAELKIETNYVSNRSPGDLRDLRAAVDWIKVSADAPGRDYVREVLDRKGVLLGIEPDRAPGLWRFRYDPNNIGNRYRPAGWSSWEHVAYDDSGFKLVPPTYLPSMRRSDAAWYRAWLIIGKDAKAVARELRIPGRGFEKEGVRQVWVNGVRIDGPNLDAAACEALIPGPNIIAVKLVKGPFPGVTGEQLVEQPVFSGTWSHGKVFFKLEHLKPKAAAGNIRARLFGPTGKPICEIRPGVEVELTEYGEHSLVFEDEKGRRQAFPIHLLGIHFFHWGWYSGSGGTKWRGFTPQSNDYVDQLFSRLDDWGVPHHSISYGGAIFAPGTGFHAAKGGDYPRRFREAIASGKLDFVGMPFPPRNICADFGESLIRSVRRSLDIYESVLGYRPTCFTSHDATLTPLLPQIMRLSGYNAYCTVENWWHQMSVPNSRDCLWRNQDGTTVRVLDSYYHGISVTEAVNRAIEQGKPAVLCQDEFACVDATGFLEKAEWDSLARRGIFLKPVSLVEYRRITEDFAAGLVHRGDDGLGYKGWTGGSEGETEFEKANRILETNLVALENVVAFARWLGISVDQGPIDEAWDLSMRWHECHLHWSNAEPTITRKFWELTDWCRAEMQRLGKLIVGRFPNGEGISVVNPLGFKRNALVSLELPEGTRALLPMTGDRKAYRVQPDPDRPGRYLASLEGLPSVGCRGYAMTRAECKPAAGANARIDGDFAVLENSLVRIRVKSDGEIVLFEDSRSRRTLVSRANRLFFARRHDLAPDEPLSRLGDPLNLAHYARPVGRSAPRIVCAGPVFAAVECDLQVRDYPGLVISLRISLAARERQARMRLTLSFRTPTAVCPREAPNQHEGCYLPGIFAAFPMSDGSRPRADMAYCLTDDVLESTNHETFLNIPFRNGTFNALSLAGPNTEEYAVLTRGLPDFFVIREPEPFLALSFGMGTPDFPYKGEYVHEYALLAPAPGTEAYKAAQGFLVDAFAVPTAVCGDLSFVQSSASDSMITGVEHRDGNVLVRVLNLSKRSVSTRPSGLLDLEGAQVSPEATIVHGRSLRLKPRSIREIRAHAQCFRDKGG